MATIEGSGSSSHTWWRYTYTLTSTDTTVTATITQVEIKDTNAPSSGSWKLAPGSLGISYYDEAYSMNTSWIQYSQTNLYPSYHTIWTGSLPITGYKQIAPTNILFNSGACTIPVPTLPTFQVTYNSDGGSAAPEAQTKYLGKTLKLTTAVPSKTGYDFINWRSSADDNLYSKGGNYTLDQSTTMTAQWNVQEYTVSYGANGGSGVVTSQRKTYDAPLYFSDGATIYRKEIVNQITQEYELLRWNTNPNDSGDSYELGSEIPNIINNLKVYAIWNLKYLYPYIGNLKVYRTATSDISDKDRADKGQYIFISFDFVGCSDDAGNTYRIPNCSIRIDDDTYTPTLSFDESPNGSFEFKASTAYSLDNPHNVIIEMVDPQYANSKFSAYDYITTGIYPIDLYDNGQLNEVYMGIMHPYINGIPLTLTDTYIDGDLDIRLDIDANASSVTPAVSGNDKDLFNKILTRGWYDDVISSDKLLLKQWANKVSDASSPSPGPYPSSPYYNEIFVDTKFSVPSPIMNQFADIIRAIVQEYPGQQYTVFKGYFETASTSSSNNYKGWYEIYILDTDDVESTSGLPRWFLGNAYHWTSSMFRIYGYENPTSGLVSCVVRDPSSINSANYTNFTFENGFTYYATSGADEPRATKRNGLVILKGSFKTISAQSSAAKVKIATINAGFKPFQAVSFVCQGSSMNRYLLTIDDTGAMYADRYGTTSHIAIPANAQLNISGAYVANVL